MRQIKFRCWDIKEKSFLKGGMNPCPDFWISPSDGVYEDQMYDAPTDWNKDNRILQQFTGLRDCHGNDIYEGDLLKSSHDIATFQSDHTGAFNLMISGRQDCIYEVYWAEGHGGFALKNLLDQQCIFSLEGVGDMEIVGNRFENLPAGEK